MPQATVGKGETVELIGGPGTSEGDIIHVRVTSGSVGFKKREDHAGSFGTLEQGQERPIEVLNDGETVYAEGLEAGSTVEYTLMGFQLLDLLTSRVETDISAQSVGTLDTGVTSFTAGTIDTDISAQSAGDIAVDLNTNSLASDLDINFDAQTQNVEMDIVQQSLANLTNEETRRSSLALTTTDLFNTSTVSSGGGQNITSIYANSGELWRMRGFRFGAPRADGASSGHYRVALNAPLSIGYMESETTYDNEVDWVFNQWHESSGNQLQNPTNTRAQIASLENITIDENNSFDVRYENLTDVDQSNGRIIQILWERFSI